MLKKLKKNSKHYMYIFIIEFLSDVFLLLGTKKIHVFMCLEDVNLWYGIWQNCFNLRFKISFVYKPALCITKLLLNVSHYDKIIEKHFFIAINLQFLCLGGTKCLKSKFLILFNVSRLKVEMLVKHMLIF